MEWNILLLLSVACLVAYLLLSFLRDPLRSVPGPLLAKLTGAWLVIIEFIGQRSTVLDQLHKKYGPVVRVAPDQLSFSSGQAMRDIYGAKGLEKAPAYGAFGRKSLFTMRNKEEHRARAKRIAHVFSPASVAQVEPIIDEQTVKLLHSLDKRVGEAVDVLHWFRMLALDVTSEIFLGKNFGGLEKEEAPQMMREIDVVFPSYWVEYQFPVLQRLLSKIPYKPLQSFLTAGDRFYRHGADAFHDYIARYGRAVTGDRRDLLTKMISGSKDSTPLTDQEIIIEITNLMFAGIDTTGNTFSYLFWELARHPEWQSRLRDELTTVTFTDGIPEYKDVREIPVLEALIQETLRIHPASPASLPRIAPSEGCTIDVTRVPASTVVSCQSYTTQRDSSVFAQSDEFLPDRWIDAQERGNADEMRDRILVWGKGTRQCLGKGIATMELKVATAALVKRYEVELGAESTNNDMEMTDHFVIIPKGGKCVLRFKQV